MNSWDAQPEETQFTPKEQEQFLGLCKKLGWRRTGKDVFEAFFPVFPMALCELAVVREINGIPHVLLWYRDDEHYKGWHMPGGYIARGENPEETARRVLLAETGLRLQSAEFARYCNSYPANAPVPNHQVALLFLCSAEGEPLQGTFFPLDALPLDTLSHHKEYISCLPIPN
ncbi:MAG: hypothetical protein G01um101470_162 [Parcubacteria group bacterium Gr01-1014_70]|nr:MAG: hypothetical protein G01um101470_162 [Parcubacteria group bacterium Gr01-1014_70]